MFEVPVAAQQCIVDALKEGCDTSQTVVLCHTPSEVYSDGNFLLGTHDLLDDFLGNKSITLISIFPNMGIVKQTLKNCKDHSFIIDCIVACHHTYDPLDASIDVVNKLGLDFQNVSQVAFVVDMPKGTYRPHATTAYRIRVQSETVSKISIAWKKQQEQFDEFLIPKFLASHDEVMSIVNNLDGPLKRHTCKRNGLFDFEGGKNYDSYSFKPGKSGLKSYKEEIERLKNICRSLCKDFPSATFQFRERINWRWLSQDGCIEATILFCRNLDHHKLLQLASFLTLCAVPFRFSSANTIVINTAGLDSSILVRLMHYAEVPIPTTLKQGAFSLCTRGNGLSAGDRSVLTFDLKIGRIGSLPSTPVQIRCTSIEELNAIPCHQSTIGRWIKRELSGFNITEVVCVDDDQVDSFLQFRVPIEDEVNYPKVFKYKGKTFSVDHALPYATPIGMRARPPQEETVHEHWKKAARLAPQEKTSHANCIAKAENCPRSLQRVMRLKESSVKEVASTVFVYAEQTKMPWCFFTNVVSQQTAIDYYCKRCISHLENKEEIETLLTSCNNGEHHKELRSDDSATVHVMQVCCKDDQPLRLGLFYEGKYGWTVSTAELVQCHAYTPCTLVIMVPPGCKLTDVCSPGRHLTTLQVFVLPSSKIAQKDTPNSIVSQLTQISPNHTASVASQASGEDPTPQYSCPVKPSTCVISPTAPWTDAAIGQESSQGESRQMPLLRRSSDQTAHKAVESPSQACPSLKKGETSKKLDATQPKGCDTDRDKQMKQPNENEQRDPAKEIKAILASPPAQKETHNDLICRNPDFVLSPQCVQGSGNELIGKDSHRIRGVTGNNSLASASYMPLPNDAKPQEDYAGGEEKGYALTNGLQSGSDGALLDCEATGCQQYVTTPLKSQLLQGGGGMQPTDTEMRDVKRFSDSRKRGVKKDLVSKSCPPSLRAVSPRTKLGQNEPLEKNQRAMQRVAAAKIRDPSQTGRGRNKDAVGEEAITTETTQIRAGHTSELADSQLAQQMQEIEGVEQVDRQIIDLIAKIEQESADQKRERLVRITDATQKWCSCLPKAHQERIISLGEKFLKRMNSTLCFLIVVYRMLAKANWTRTMVAVDIKQAALYAISKGWYVKASEFCGYPFTREEFAVSAATYLDKIPADAPEDAFRALYVVISHLPTSCAKLFSKGQVSCPYCLACCDVSFPSITSRCSWIMPNWIDLATCLNSAEPNPWMHSHGWHATDCTRSDHIPNVTAFESWTLLELHLHQPTDFPTLIGSQKLTSDPSLAVMNGQILGFVCANTRSFDDPNKHYWFVEVEGGALRYAFDSLKGLQRLTQDIAKKLFVTGVLIFFGPKRNPILRSPELDAAAGLIPRVVRPSNPISVQGRLRANKVRNFLCRQHGVKKRRYKPAISCRASGPVKKKQCEKQKNRGVGAVTRPAKGRKTSSRGRGSRKAPPSSLRRSTAIEKSKISSAGQIDKLFQLQRRDDPGTPNCYPDRCSIIEDISDEKFEKGNNERSGQHEKVSKSVLCENEPMGRKEDAAQKKKDSAAAANNPCMSLGEDPIESFSDDRTTTFLHQPGNGDLLPSPVKNKRNTDRTARNHSSSNVPEVANQTEGKHHGSEDKGKEQGTTDLIREGLMNENNKKQKAIIDASTCVPCFDGQVIDTKCQHNRDPHVNHHPIGNKKVILLVIAAVTQLCHLMLKLR